MYQEVRVRNDLLQNPYTAVHCCTYSNVPNKLAYTFIRHIRVRTSHFTLKETFRNFQKCHFLPALNLEKKMLFVPSFFAIKSSYFCTSELETRQPTQPYCAPLVCPKYFFCKQLSLVVNKQGQRTMKTAIKIFLASPLFQN